MKRRKHIKKEFEKGLLSNSKWIDVQSDIQDGQSSTEFEDGKSFPFEQPDDHQDFDENISDLNYKDELDEDDYDKKEEEKEHGVGPNGRKTLKK
ncbi:hypothetical protein NDU88_005301 [Pleurodeles waltl]|uniref:Uncharacterized protein n=1 Tax=Pleurodeles waltl TaxID=8319 RepID=A0AAV7TBU9_PLEWA|nr:hypothetical protein NDU88_005301 [Pleurodeles waltl]